MRTLKLGILVFLLSMLAAQVNAKTKTSKTKQPFIPNGWVLAPLNATENLTEYLSDQYQLARENGKTAYAYIYNENNFYCRKVRKTYNKKLINETFSGAHIVMLDFKPTKKAHQGRWRWGRRSQHSEPAIVKISESGLLTRYDYQQPHLQRGAYRTYAHRSHAHRMQTHIEPGTSRHIIAKQLRRFFRRYSENEDRK